MVRIATVLALLATLFFLVRHLQPDPPPGFVEKAGPPRPAASAGVEAGEGGGVFNPSVATPLPDVGKGYIFSEKRKIEKDEPPDALKAVQVEQGPDPLETVMYSGSVIAGELRRAVVIYQEQAREASPSRRPARGAAPAPAAGGGTRNKQLNQGEHFLGYVVESIEPARIVFAKGDRKVEKFLYDQKKKRLEPPEPSRPAAAPVSEPGGVPLQALAPPEVLAALLTPPPPTSGRLARGVTPARTTPLAPAPSVPVEQQAAANGSGQAPPTRVVRRSQRILGIDPSINVPASPVPGLPVPIK